MPDQSAEMAALAAARAQNPGPSATYAPKVNPVFTGDFTHSGTKFGVNGATPVARAAAIAAPTAAGASYAQAQVTSMVTAIDALRTALKNAGITL